MDEIMIRSMYRSQSRLAVEVSSALTRLGDGLGLTASITNKSELVGTVPRLSVELAFQLQGGEELPSPIGISPGFITESEISDGRLTGLWMNKQSSLRDYNLRVAFGRTGKKFADDLLYPYDAITILPFGYRRPMYVGQHVLLRTVVNFAESRPHAEVALFDLDDPGSATRGTDEDIANLFAALVERLSPF